MIEKSQKKRAIALKYPEGVEAPIIMAKGEGRNAQIMLEEAEKNGIHIAEDAVLVDLLGMSEVGTVVPESAWKALAVIFSFILSDGDSSTGSRRPDEH